MVDYSIDTTNDVDLSRLERMKKEKMEFFQQNHQSIKYWETPLQPVSLLKMIDDIMKQNGIELVFEDIYDYKKSKKHYNTNLCNSLRGKDLLYCMTLRMTNKEYGENFDTDFVETIIQVSTKTSTFRNLTTSDVLLYDFEDRKTDLFLKLAITSIKSEEDYDMFIAEFKYHLEHKFETSIICTLKKYRPIIYLKSDIFAEPDISFLEKKKEKLVRMKNGPWSYYQPADWIRYPIKDQYISNEAREGWLTLYHPLGGFDFSKYGNIKVCDDLGPNQFKIELANFPLDQGIFMTPRLNYIMGHNQQKIYHAAPTSVKCEKDTEYYYMIAFECYVNQDRLRVPSVFKRRPC